MRALEERGDDASQSERGSEANNDAEQNGLQAIGNHQLQSNHECAGVSLKRMGSATRRVCAKSMREEYG